MNVSILLVVVGAILSVVVLIKLLHLSVFILFHPHALGMFTALTVLLFMFFAFLWMHVRVPVPMIGVPNPNANFRFGVQGIPIAHRVAVAGKAELPARAEKPSAAATRETESVQSNESTPATHAEVRTTNSPKWISQPPHREGDSYVVVVRLDADTSPAERDEWLDQRMLVAANDYIDKYLYPGQDVSKIVKFNPKYLYDNCLKEVYPSSGLSDSGREVFARLEFDKRFREDVDRRYQEIIGLDRLRSFGSVALVGLAALSGLYVYLRASTAKPAKDSQKVEAAAVS
jgi:hypothetical protein